MYTLALCQDTGQGREGDCGQVCTDLSQASAKHIHKYLLINTLISLSLYLNVTSQLHDSLSSGWP